MTLCRLILRSLRRSSSSLLHHHQHPPLRLSQSRCFAFSSAEEAAAERCRLRGYIRIQPRYRDPNAPRRPNLASELAGPRLSLHNRVQSLIRAGDLEFASAVARHSVFSVTRPTVFTCNAIIAAMYRAERYNEVIDLFHLFFSQSNIIPNIVSYNNLINTHCDEGRVDVALEIYRHIVANAPFSPSPVTYRHLTNGLIDAGRIGEALDLLREMLNKGNGADSLVYNNLISGFLNLENLEKANELFDELKERCLVYDGVVNATYMEWFFNKGRDKEAMESYKSLMDRGFRMTPATCNVLLEVLLKHGKKHEAWALFDQMLDNHTPPNFQAVNSDTFDLMVNKESYKSLMDRRFRMTPPACNVLLEFLLKHGKKHEAWALFDQMLDYHTPPNFQAVNSDTFNVMVNECFKLGKFAEALATFNKVGTKPNSKPFAMDVAGYNNIIARFCENEMLSEAETLFEELCSKSLSPDVQTHRTLIDAYLKMERVDDALRVFNRMVDAGLRVVACFGNRVFDELIKNGKAIDCALILSKMGERDPKPDPTCYEVVIKGLCGEGLLDKSRELLDEVMRYQIGVTSALREFVAEAFKKTGRAEEIERLLDMNRFGYTQDPPYRPPSQMTGQHLPGPPPQVSGQQWPPLPPGQMARVHNSPSGPLGPPPSPSHMTGMHQP